MYDKAYELSVQLIQTFEGCKLEAYPDPKHADGKPWTIGWGATGRDIGPGLIWTQAQADLRLKQDTTRFFKSILELIRCANTDHQLAAMTSLAYNIGLGAFTDSKLLKYFNKGFYEAAANAFLDWNHIDGKVDDALTLRRQRERLFFLS